VHSRTTLHNRVPADQRETNVPAGTLALVRSPQALRCSKEQNALHTLIHQRHLTPSCGGHAPTAERTLNPARMFMESLTPGPELENSQGQERPMHSVPVPINVRCYSDSDAIVRRSEVMLRADTVL